MARPWPFAKSYSVTGAFPFAAARTGCAGLAALNAWPFNASASFAEGALPWATTFVTVVILGGILVVAMITVTIFSC
jgi:hypothetical protein